MKMTIEKAELTGDEIRILAKFTASLDALAAEAAGARSYELDNVKHLVRSTVAEAVAKEYLREKKMEILNAVSLKEITDAIQLKVVEGFSLNRQ
jgi:hypothetical protein